MRKQSKYIPPRHNKPILQISERGLTISPLLLMHVRSQAPYRHGTGKSYSSTEISVGKVNEKTMKKLFFFFFLIEIMWSTVRLNKEKAYIFLKFSDLLDLFAPSWGTTPCLCKTLKRLPDYHYHAQHNREGTPLATLPTTQPRSPAGHQRLTGSE